MSSITTSYLIKKNSKTVTIHKDILPCNYQINIKDLLSPGRVGNSSSVLICRKNIYIKIKKSCVSKSCYMGKTSDSKYSQ